MSMLKTTIENLASRIAGSRDGKLVPADLLPYLPISLELAEKHLHEMVDGSIVIENESGEVRGFEFPEFFDREPKPIESGNCIVCPKALGNADEVGLCRKCNGVLEKELFALAETTAWPAQAIKDHEVLFITSAAEGPITMAAVAGKSRMTLKRVKEELKAMAKRKFARAVINENDGILSYEFPKIEYEEPAFQRNDRFIRRHPSSLKEEVEIRIIKSLTAVAIIIGLCMVGAIFHFPFALLLLAGLIASGVTTASIFLKKQRVMPAQLGES